MNKMLNTVRAALKNSSDKTTQESFQRFFKEKVSCYGVKTGVVTKIARMFWKEIKHCSKKEIFTLCEELFRSDYCEEAFIAAEWLPKLTSSFEPQDLAEFKRWIEKYVNNWAKCDSFCNHTVGNFIEKYPECLNEMKRWTSSENRWLKRASAVSLIIPAKKGKFLKDIFEIAYTLLEDTDDMVQKGYGWLLKEASRTHQKEVFNFVVSHKKDMPRTALRYAIELMPKDLKTRAMLRE